MGDYDPIHAAFLAVVYWVAAWIGIPGWPTWLAGPVAAGIHLMAYACLISVLFLVAALLRSALESEVRSRLGHAALWVRLICVAGSGVLLFWIVRSPPRDLTGLVTRWDHLALCTLMGVALHRSPIAVRKWTLILLSVYLVSLVRDHVAQAVSVAACLLSYAVARIPGRPLLQVILQVAVLGTAYVLTVSVPRTLMALQIHGIFAWMVLRQLSFVVESRRGYPATLGCYLYYMMFYPSFLEASEVYDEFSDRNGRGDTRIDYRAVAANLLLGNLYMAAALNLHTTNATVLASPNTPALWLNLFLVFVRSALFAMGLWMVMREAGSLYGVTLRANFPGVLWCQNPIQFWRAWRATMTNWLIRYVYIPLGGNRRSHFRNIVATFAVSVLWHVSGIPIYSSQSGLLVYIPVVTWGALNAVGVIGYSVWRRMDVQILPAGTPWIVRAVPKIVLTGLYGSLTMILLGFRDSTFHEFVWFCRTLVGLG